MTKPGIFGFCVLGVTLLAAAARADDCAKPQLLNTIQMIRSPGTGIDVVPLDIGGTSLNFLLGSGSYLTMIRQSVADSLKLAIHPGNIRTMHVVTATQTDAVIPAFKLGLLSSSDTTFHISPETEAANGGFVMTVERKNNAPPTSFTVTRTVGLGGNRVLGGSSFMMGEDVDLSTTSYQTAVNTKAYDGVFGLDLLTAYDADIDFGTDTYRMFSSDHCFASEVYWNAPALAVVAITATDGLLHIPVEMDGQKFSALIDTSSSVSTLRFDVANLVYGLSLDPKPAQAPAPDQAAGAQPGVSETAIVNGVRVTEHTFHTLDFGGVTVTNPHMMIVPNSSGYLLADREHVTGSLIDTQMQFLNVPEVTIGMDILRKLHIYIASKEGNMYITEASIPDAKQPSP